MCDDIFKEMDRRAQQLKSKTGKQKADDERPVKHAKGKGKGKLSLAEEVVPALVRDYLQFKQEATPLVNALTAVLLLKTDELSKIWLEGVKIWQERNGKGK